MKLGKTFFSLSLCFMLIVAGMAVGGFTFEARSPMTYFTRPLALTPWDFGCDAIYAREWLDGLSPSYSIAECYYDSNDTLSEYATSFQPVLGCWPGIYRSYVIYKDDIYQLASEPGQLRALYAPIESPAEALSYAVLMTGLGLGSPDSSYPEVANFEAQATIALDGYRVRVLDVVGAACSCDTREYEAVTLAIGRTGKIQEVARELIVSEEGRSCID